MLKKKQANISMGRNQYWLRPKDFIRGNVQEVHWFLIFAAITIFRLPPAKFVLKLFSGKKSHTSVRFLSNVKRSIKRILRCVSMACSARGSVQIGRCSSIFFVFNTFYTGTIIKNFRPSGTFARLQLLINQLSY